MAARAPVSGKDAWRNLRLQALAVAVIAPTLILASCFLAAWIFARAPAPSVHEVTGAISANLFLIVLCLSLLLAAIQAAPRLLGSERAPRDDWPDWIIVSEKGRLVVIDLASVDWIETQGNYQALHAAGGTHLLRETAASLAGRLDPKRFVRIHRRFIVAADKVRDIEPLSNGDALVRLADGVELRQSRAYRRALRSRLGSSS